MQDQISRTDRLSFYERQQGIRGKDMVPDEVLDRVRDDGGFQSDTGEKAESLFDAIRKAFGAPKTIMVAGLKVRIESPTVDGLLAFIADVQDLERRKPEDFESQTLRLVKTLMADSLEFPEEAPADVKAWIGKLRTTAATDLMEGFSQVFDFKVLMAQVNRLRGKAGALGMRASPGKN